MSYVGRILRQDISQYPKSFVSMIFLVFVYMEWMFWFGRNLEGDSHLAQIVRLHNYSIHLTFYLVKFCSEFVEIYMSCRQVTFQIWGVRNTTFTFSVNMAPHKEFLYSLERSHLHKLNATLTSENH